jgi:hypothetical protein
MLFRAPRKNRPAAGSSERKRYDECAGRVTFPALKSAGGVAESPPYADELLAKMIVRGNTRFKTAWIDGTRDLSFRALAEGAASQQMLVRFDPRLETAMRASRNRSVQ